jgi:glycosyltransferase involved in cell wall biosynthesis
MSNTRATDAGHGLRVLGTSSQGAADAAFRVRLELPARGLGAHGVELELLPLFSEEATRRFREAGAFAKARALASSRRRLKGELEAAEASAVVVQRGVDLTPSLALERAATRGRRLIYDVDDAIWLSGPRTGGHRLSSLKGAARRVRWLAERAEHTIAGNEILAEHLAPYGPVTVVPSLVDPDSYGLHEHKQGEEVTLGWIGSPTTAPYLGRVAGVLDRFATASDRPVRLLVIGGSASPLEGVRVEERAWSPAAERQALAEIDVGLMPLPDTPWTRGKCAYKALQYMAAGVPAVVDDVGISAAAVAGAGYAVSGEDQWLEALGALAADAGLRGELGAAGRRRIEADFSPRRWLPTIAAIIKGES